MPRWQDIAGWARDNTLLLIGVIIGIAHLYFLWALGATFGYDSFVYAQLGEALATRGGLLEFYSGPRYYIFQHVSPGLPLLWNGATLVGGDYGWLLFALIQHAVAAASLFYLLAVARAILVPGPLLILIAVVVACNPIYQSLHSQPMTESISGSMYLLGFAAVMKMLIEGAVRLWPLAVLTLSGFAAIQFRSQAVVYFLVFLGGVLIAKLDGRWRGGVIGCLLLVVSSALVWPAYRSAMTGHVFLPNASYLSLVHALRYNPQPSQEFVSGLKKAQLLPKWDAEQIAKNGLSYSEAAEWGRYLRSIGFDDADAKQEIKPSMGCTNGFCRHYPEPTAIISTLSGSSATSISRQSGSGRPSKLYRRGVRQARGVLGTLVWWHCHAGLRS
jgi:hypothetical protein